MNYRFSSKTSVGVTRNRNLYQNFIIETREIQGTVPSNSLIRTLSCIVSVGLSNTGRAIRLVDTDFFQHAVFRSQILFTPQFIYTCRVGLDPNQFGLQLLYSYIYCYIDRGTTFPAVLFNVNINVSTLETLVQIYSIYDT